MNDHLPINVLHELAEKMPYSKYNPYLRIFGEYNYLLQSKTADDFCFFNINLNAFKPCGIEAREWSEDTPREYILKIELK